MVERPRRHNPFPDQTRAVNETTKGFETIDRGQMERACGTGKTYVGQLVSEELCSKLTVIIVPSLALLSQTLRSWQEQAKEPFCALAVCSDSSVTQKNAQKDDDADDISVDEIRAQNVEVTTSKNDIGSFLKDNTSNSTQVIFTTYQSCNEVIAAIKASDTKADLTIADEAHLIATEESSEESGFRNSLNIPTKKLLFMTATPRIYQDRGEDSDQVISMDDPTLFGPTFHRYPFAEAIKDGRLSDYEVLVIGIEEKELAKWLKDKGTNGRYAAAEISLAGQLALLRAAEEYDIHSVIAFLNRVQRAKDFSRPGGESSIQTVAEATGWLEGLKKKGAIKSVEADHVDGSMKASLREDRLKALKFAHKEGKLVVIANCSCLGVGIDVPSLDAVLMIDPRRSKIETAQIVGRVIRKDQGGRKEKGRIIVPVIIGSSDSPEEALSHSSFKEFYEVLRALRAHDSRLGESFDSLRRAVATGDPVEIEKRKDKIAATVKIFLPHTLEESKIDVELARKLSNQIYLKAASTVGLKEELTEEKIIAWCKAYYQRGLEAYRKDPEKNPPPEWPNSKTKGRVPDVAEWKWVTIDILLWTNKIGPSNTGTGLTALLAKHQLNIITEEKILKWCNAYYERTRAAYLNDPSKNPPPSWPNGQTPDRVPEAPEWSWRIVDESLRRGANGLSTAGIGLTPFLAKHKLNILTEEKIIMWCKAHYRRTLEAYSKDPGNNLPPSWPNRRTPGRVLDAPEWSWAAIDDALTVGRSGLSKSGAGLATFLESQKLNILDEEKIVTWCKAYYRRTLGVYLNDPGSSLPPHWPSNITHGRIQEAPEWSWRIVDVSLRTGGHGLEATGSGLYGLLKKHGLNNLTEEKIVEWCKADYLRTYSAYVNDSLKSLRPSWPSSSTLGRVQEAPEWSWKAIEQSLRTGRNGLPKSGGGIRQLLRKYHLTTLTEPYILKLCRGYYYRTLVSYLSDPTNHPLPNWPNVDNHTSIPETPERTWCGVDHSLKSGYESSLATGPGLSLAKFLSPHIPRLIAECESDLRASHPELFASESSLDELLALPTKTLRERSIAFRDRSRAVNGERNTSKLRAVTTKVLQSKDTPTFSPPEGSFTECRSLMVVGGETSGNEFYMKVAQARTSTDWDELAPEYQERLLGLTSQLVTGAAFRALCTEYGVPKSILSVGSGPGVLFESAKVAGIATVVHDLDIAPSMIANSANPNKKVGDAKSIPYPASTFSCIECSSTFRLGDSKAIEQFMRSSHQVLEDNGLLWLKADGVKFSSSFIAGAQKIGFKLLNYPNAQVSIPFEVTEQLSPNERGRVLSALRNSSFLIFQKTITTGEEIVGSPFTYLRRANADEVTNHFKKIVKGAPQINAGGELGSVAGAKFLESLSEFKNTAAALPTSARAENRVVALQLIELYTRSILLKREVPSLTSALKSGSLEKDAAALQKVLTKQVTELLKRNGPDDWLTQKLTTLNDTLAEVRKWK